MTREKMLENALKNLLDYTVDVLTGPIMSKQVTWPEGGPRQTAPILIQAQESLDRPRCDEFVIGRDAERRSWLRWCQRIGLGYPPPPPVSR